VVSYNGTERRARLNPSANLRANTTYKVTLTGGATAIRATTGGVPLDVEPWSFTTAPPPPPTVTTTTPVADATGVSRTANLSVGFSQAVTGVSAASVVLTNTDTGAVLPALLTMNATNNRVTINPSATLPANTEFRVDLIGSPTRIRAATGGTPLVSRSLNFTTVP
jgi:hypothetical protein